MTAKEYLAQASQLDERIKLKMARLNSLGDLATKATATLSGMPHNPSGSKSRMADTVEKIIDLQREVETETDELVNLQKELAETIKAVPDLQLRMVLERRYLCFQSFEEIAVEMKFNIRWVYRLHGRALQMVDRILAQREPEKGYERRKS